MVRCMRYFRGDDPTRCTEDNRILRHQGSHCVVARCSPVTALQLLAKVEKAHWEAHREAPHPAHPVVIQNGANSAVGRAVIQLAKVQGKTLTNPRRTTHVSIHSLFRPPSPLSHPLSPNMLQAGVRCVTQQALQCGSVEAMW